MTGVKGRIRLSVLPLGSRLGRHAVMEVQYNTVQYSDGSTVQYSTVMEVTVQGGQTGSLIY